MSKVYGDSVVKVIDEYFKPYGLEKRVVGLINETHREFVRNGYVLTDELIVKGLLLMVDIAENEAIRNRSIERIGYFLSKTLDNKVLKNYLLLYVRFGRK